MLLTVCSRSQQSFDDSRLNVSNQPEADSPRSVLQRKEPVTAGRRTYDKRHQAALEFSGWR